MARVKNTPQAVVVEGAHNAKNSASEDLIVLQAVSDNKTLEQLKAGSSPHGRDVLYGATALHAAAQNGRMDLVKLLVDAGLDLNARDKLGDTVLHWACYGGSEVATRFLLDQWVDPNVVNKASKTPLHYATQQGYEKCVRTLLEWGADVFAEDNDSETPLDLAWSVALQAENDNDGSMEVRRRIRDDLESVAQMQDEPDAEEYVVAASAGPGAAAAVPRAAVAAGGAATQPAQLPSGTERPRAAAQGLGVAQGGVAKTKPATSGVGAAARAADAAGDLKAPKLVKKRAPAAEAGRGQGRNRGAAAVAAASAAPQAQERQAAPAAATAAAASYYPTSDPIDGGGVVAGADFLSPVDEEPAHQQVQSEDDNTFYGFAV